MVFQPRIGEWNHSSQADLKSQNPTFLLSRLVLTNADPVTTLARRSAVIHDDKIFNLQLKGVGPKAQYPGPRVNQAASGRCWLFATSEGDLGSWADEQRIC
jgi:aminopeptidase C